MYGLAFMRTPFMVRFFRGPFCFRIIRSPFLVRKSLNPYPDSDFYGIRYLPDKKSVFSGRLFSLCHVTLILLARV